MQRYDAHQVVQARDVADEASVLGRKFRIAEIPEFLAVGGELRDPGIEGLIDPQDAAVELDRALGWRPAGYLETLVSQPMRNFVEVRVRGPETLGVFLWSQPLVILRRLWILLRSQQLVQLGLIARLEPDLQRQRLGRWRIAERGQFERIRSDGARQRGGLSRCRPRDGDYRDQGEPDCVDAGQSLPVDKSRGFRHRQV